MFEHGDLFRDKLNDDLYMIISEVDNKYHCVKIMNPEECIMDEEFFKEHCTYNGNIAKGGRK